jgi:hypothetical protein
LRLRAYTHESATVDDNDSQLKNARNALPSDARPHPQRPQRSTSPDTICALGNATAP